MKWFHVSGVDAVGLLLQREQLPLPERVHRRVGVLVQLRQGGDVDGHAQRSAAPCSRQSVQQRVRLRMRLIL
jgi:hypothetical protein